MTQRRCPDCHEWYDKQLGPCPVCGAPAPKFNKWLKTARMNNQLYGQAAHAAAEKVYADAHGL